MGNGSYWDGAGWSTVQVDSPFDKAKVFVQTTAPTDPTPMRTGDLFIDSGTSRLQYRSNDAWNNLSVAAADVSGLTLSNITNFPSAVSTTELSYLDGVTSAIQTQLNGKAASSHTHTVSQISDLTATATELNYVDGVTSNVQTQLNGKAASSHTHTVSQLSDTSVTAAQLNYLTTLTGNVQTQLNGKQASGSYAAASHTHTLANITDVTATAAELNKLHGVTATTAQMNYLVGVTSAIQTQLNGKQASGSYAASSHTHTLSQITDYPVDSGWTTMTLATGTGTSRYRVLNGVVYVQISITGASVPDSATATDLVLAANGIPSGYRPSNTVYASANFAGQFIGQVLVQVTGAVSAVHKLGSTMSTVRGLIQYPVGA